MKRLLVSQTSTMDSELCATEACSRSTKVEHCMSEGDTSIGLYWLQRGTPLKQYNFEGRSKQPNVKMKPMVGHCEHDLLRSRCLHVETYL